MADDVQVTEGTGKTVATQDRSGRHFQQMIDTGAENIAVTRRNADTSGTINIAARANRKRLLIQHLGDQVVDCGPSGVTSGNGWPIYPGDVVVLLTVGAVYFDALSGTQALAILEEYDA